MLSKSVSIQEIVSGNKVLESVVERFGFEKCDHNRQLDEICAKYKADSDFVLLILKAFSEGMPFPENELRSFSIPVILDYLKKTHAFYLERKIPEIELSFTAICRDYSFSHPQLLVLANLFMDYKKDLVEHIDYEEYVLFPYIEELIKVKEQGRNLSAFGLDKYSIASFNDEHHHEEDILTEIRRSIEKRFRKNMVPLPFRIFLHQVETLEKDLLKHARIEDDILIPKAFELENELKP